MVWFIVAVGVVVLSQIARLFQVEPLPWLACDYAGRIGALLILLLIPQARSAGIQNSERHLTGWKLVAGIIALAPFERIGWHIAHSLLPSRGIGGYPNPQGWLRLTDLTFGLALVAFSEEFVFRRHARNALRNHLGDGAAMVIASSLVFGAYHWTFGMRSIATAGLFGIATMIFYKATNRIWPVSTSHYLADIAAFY